MFSTQNLNGVKDLYCDHNLILFLPLTYSHSICALQDSLASKVNVDDLGSLMPSGGGGGADEAATASLMSKLIEIQNRLAQLEGET